MSELLNRPQPLFDESISGFLMRLALSNYKDKPQYVYKLLSIYNQKRINSYYFDTTLLNDDDLFLLSELACCDRASLEKLFIKVKAESANTFEFFDAILDSTALSIRKVKICPMCLQQSKYIRKIWSLVNFTACPHHKIMLVDRCNQCSKPLSWWSPRVFQCDCGFEYEKSKTVCASLDCLIISEKLYEKCGLYRPIAIETECSDVIDTLDFNSFNSIILFFAKHLSDIKNVGYFSGIHFNLEDLSLLQSRVMEIFRSWPASFESFLEQVKTKKLNNNYKNIMGDFGEFYSELFDERNSALLILRREFIKYIIINYKNYACSNFTKIVNKYEEMILSGNDAALHLKISREKLIRLINNGELEGNISSDLTGNSIIVLKDSLETYKERLKSNSWLSFSEARSYLGIGWGIDDLKNYGYINYIYKDYDYSNSKYHDRQSLDELLEKMRSKIKISNDNTKAERIDFKKVVNIGQANKLCSTGLLVRMILNDEILPCGLGNGYGLNELEFNKSEVKDFFKRKIIENNGEYLRTTDVSNLLGVKDHCINFWVEIGLLKAVYIENVFGKFFTLETVQKFKLTYISLDQIRSIFIPDIQISFSKLEKMGLTAVTGNKLDGGFKYLYLMEDVKNFFENRKYSDFS
jgi:hypothetical protein